MITFLKIVCISLNFQSSLAIAFTVPHRCQTADALPFFKKEEQNNFNNGKLELATASTSNFLLREQAELA